MGNQVGSSISAPAVTRLTVYRRLRVKETYLMKLDWSAKEGITDEAARACYSSTSETQTTIPDEAALAR